MDHCFYVATRKGLFMVIRSERTWRISNATFLGDNCTSVLVDPRDRVVYVALDHGHFGAKLHRSEDDGQSWTEITTPVYPERRPDETPWTDMHGRVVPHSLQSIWTMEAGHPEQSNRIWCGTIPGGLFKSDDRGESWELVRGLWDDPLRKKWFGGGVDYPGIHSICVHPEDAAQIVVGVSCGGVWKSDDGGECWACIGEGMRADYLPPDLARDKTTQDVHRLVQCVAQPNRLWIQHHNGIFRSDDGGYQWQELGSIEPSVFGFATAVHPHDPDTAWFVPAIKDEKRIPVDGRVVVTRTRDAGTSFQVLREGLPRVHAYDLVYRHGLDIDSSGEMLAFGSTTGSLWTSENQGENWHCVSHTLPPIYQVKFCP